MLSETERICATHKISEIPHITLGLWESENIPVIARFVKNSSRVYSNQDTNWVWDGGLIINNEAKRFS